MSTNSEQLKELHAGSHYKHATVGNPNEVTTKHFTRDVMGITGAEISFGVLEPGQAVPFFHKHQQNEEIYIILTGKGSFQVDNDLFPVEAGSLVRVSAEGIRSLKCISKDSLRYICIQVKADSLEQCTMTDGVIVEHKALW